MPDVGRLADQLDGLALDVRRVLLGGGTLLGILRLDPGAVGLEQLAVGFVGAERLLVGKKIVAGKAVLHMDDVADCTKLLDPFEQDDFHGPLLLISRGREEGRCGGRA